MNIQLNPPPVPPLDPSKRSRLRNRVMDQTRPTTAHSAWRWAVPVVAVGAVAVVVAGTLVVTDKSSTEPGVAGTPAPSSVATSSGAPKVDLGAVPRALLPELHSDCRWPDEPEDAKLLWSRHVRGITTDSTAAVAVAIQPKKFPLSPEKSAARKKDGRSAPSGPSAYELGVRICMARTPRSARTGASGSTAIVADKVWTSQPTAAQGLKVLGSSGSDLTRDSRTLQSWAVYRARPEIARVEARSVWKGKFGAWTEGVVSDGFAYTEVQANGKFVLGNHLKQQVRAFDAAGKPVPVNL